MSANAAAQITVRHGRSGELCILILAHSCLPYSNMKVLPQGETLDNPTNPDRMGKYLRRGEMNAYICLQATTNRQTLPFTITTNDFSIFIKTGFSFSKTMKTRAFGPTSLPDLFSHATLRRSTTYGHVNERNDRLPDSGELAEEGGDRYIVFKCMTGLGLWPVLWTEGR